MLPSHTTAGEWSDKRPEDKLAPILKQSLVSNNNMRQAEAIAHPLWSPFSGNVLLKRDPGVCEMSPSYLVDLSTVLKCNGGRNNGCQ